MLETDCTSQFNTVHALTFHLNIHFNIISTFVPGLQSVVCPSQLPIHATCPAQLILLD